MDAVKFIEERDRMCESFGDKCVDCPANKVGLSCVVGMQSTLDATAQITIVEEWSAEHPRKTRQSEFLKQWPNARLDEDGYIVFSPCLLEAEYEKIECYNGKCADCRHEYWMQGVE